MSGTLDCPETAPWHLLLDGNLPAEERERFQHHLDSCPVCQVRIDQAQECQDDLLQLARQMGDPTGRTIEPTLAQILQRLHQTRPSERTPAAEPADLYFLHPCDRPGVLGLLGEYEVQEVIGQGGMGIVLKAFDPGLNRLVAIKVMAAAVAGNSTARRRFIREAQAAAAVSHEHIVPFHAVHETEGLPYLVMQYIAGESLQARLNRTGPLEIQDIVRIGLQTAAGLAAAHAQGLIHRDIKPANLLLENGLARVRITDFGLARLVDETRLTQSGVVAGTPEYMAPEQARGEPIDHRADLFSLGSVLYAMGTGVPPFQGPTPVAVLRQVSDQPPAPLRTLNPAVPAWLETLIGRLLAKDPSERFQSAAEVAGLLEGYLAHLRQPAVPPPELPAPEQAREPGKKKLRGRRRFLLLGGLAALGLIGTGFFLSQQGPDPMPQAAVAPAPQLPKEPKLFRQDFRNQVIDEDFFKYTGPSARRVVRQEAEGLRISLPVPDAKSQATGLEMSFPIKGDFEITTSYELLKTEDPPKGNGAWISLYLVTLTPTKEAAMLSRSHRPGGHYYVCHRITYDANGNRLYPSKTIPTDVRSGKLRLVRRGSLITYLVADGNSNEFRELHQADLGTEDVKGVRIAADPGNKNSLIEARFLDFEIRSPDLPTVSSGGPLVPPRSRGWLSVFLVLALVIALALVSLAVWFSRRNTGPEEPSVFAPKPDSEDNPEPALSPILFSCSGCGKTLKAAAALAAKKIKCPRCGQAEVVPAIQTSPPDRSYREPS